MADDRGKDTPSLEPPSLGLRRRRRRQQEQAPAPIPHPDPSPALGPALEPALEPAGPAAPAAATSSTPPKQPGARQARAPRITGLPAAVLTGLVVGLLTVSLTVGSLRACDAVRGTATCGGGPGLFLLLAILTAMVLVGGALLRVFRVPDPGSTSFLAVGLLAVMSLLFLVEVLTHWTMFVVVPLVAMATYAVSHWVTTAVIDPTSTPDD